ncbi:unnamed protein product [Linum tenue]|uniref:Uncharacterized protein n=1 Tax=Linum tenue TaxID=586396 RepID=A0AAV0MM22_9ROSI|nr:unnamed protein product [Linum tenue]
MVGSKKELTSYEEIRRQRVEENKKRMEALNLLKLAKHLRPQSNPSAKPSPAKPRPRRPAVLAPARRSARIADNPTVSYKERPVEPLMEARRFGTRRSSRIADKPAVSYKEVSATPSLSVSTLFKIRASDRYTLKLLSGFSGRDQWSQYGKQEGPLATNVKMEATQKRKTKMRRTTKNIRRESRTRQKTRRTKTRTRKTMIRMTLGGVPNESEQVEGSIQFGAENEDFVLGTGNSRHPFCAVEKVAFPR